MSCVLQEQVFISYDGKQSLAKAKGVDWVYEDESPIRDHLIEGEFKLQRGDVPLAAVGGALAYELGLSPRFLSGIEIYYPARTRKLSAANPMASVESIKVWPSCTFTLSNDIDGELMILPIEKMRELLEYDDEVSAVEIRLADGTDKKELKRLQKEITDRLGGGFEVKDRFQQNESLYKMMKYEKAAIYMILIFIIIIIAFNIFGSLSMLIIEKKDDIRTLSSLGATDSLIRRIFVLEGWMISLVGLVFGLIAGVGFSLLQQHFGFIKMPGSFMVQAYPVILSVSDILLTVAGVSLIGYLIALLPVYIYRKRS
jgi:ABC-type lipoprotein release transport system permease subunit